MTFGEKIRNLRESNGMLLRELAALLNIDTALLSKIERNERRAKREQLAILSTLLHISEQELLTLWLANQLYDILKDEENATAALKVAEKQIEYIRKIK
ncbi:helix-turn-helix transcriptional regulator [Candidatus Kaistella beijingensis]|nr:helix-turn-helix transcriptional regulator [Candidatus Kaistella beijingensis]